MEVYMAELNISKRQLGDITILDMNGDILFGQGNITLRCAIRRLLSEGKKKILLNFSAVNFVDSGGIGELISGLIAVNREGGQLKLLNLTQRIKYLLDITKLLTVFKTFEDEAEAISSYDQIKLFCSS
jgi:anti-sigma B factor antagonist